MNRKVLLVEPNYQNKYPPMGLMKLASYYRTQKDDVRFYKGDMKNLAAEILCEELICVLNIMYSDFQWNQYYPELLNFIRLGRYSALKHERLLDIGVLGIIKDYRSKYRDKEYFEHPRFDKVGITTLFTFYWDITIETINFAKKLCKRTKDVMVGGIMASLLPDEVFEATGIYPFIGQLNKPGVIDQDDQHIIDEMPLDYSILEEIDYTYPAKDAYFAYMTRGCCNHCAFCAVPKLEPKYRNYIGIKEQILETNKRFGEQKDLLLLDNNVLASNSFEQIIDEIKECGFGKGATYTQPNAYDITIQNLRDSYNDRAYIRKACKIYQELISHLHGDEKEKFTETIITAKCNHIYTATKEEILKLDDYVRPIYERIYHSGKRVRVVDFNQGVDSRKITDENMQKLSEVNIKPLRIAFDHWNLRDTYEKAVRTAVRHGILNLSNYLLYNFEDEPEELYYRLRLNVELCDELGAKIYSFPMKYHPIREPDYFKNRDYVGEHWNRKFIRAVQAVLNSTKGKIGQGRSFFEEAFGKDVEEFHKILWMPETFIIYRRKYNQELSQRLADRYTNSDDNFNNMTQEWYEKFMNLSKSKLKKAQEIIKKNKFKPGEYDCEDKAIREVLSYYQIER